MCDITNLLLSNYEYEKYINFKADKKTYGFWIFLSVMFACRCFVQNE